MIAGKIISIQIPTGIASVAASPVCSLTTLKISTSANVTKTCTCSYDSVNRMVNITINSTWTTDLSDFVHWVSISTMKNWPYAGSFSGFSVSL